MEKSMKNRSRHGKALRCLAVLCLAGLAVGTVGFTRAYKIQSQMVRNEYQTGKYSTQLVEEFESPSDWLPGVETNKDVSVTNDGTVPVYAKITMSQEWIRRENVYDSQGNVVLPAKGDHFPLTFAGEAGEEYASLMIFGTDVVLLASGQTATPSLSLGLPTVSSVEEAKGKWLLTSETPDTDGAFTFYYIGVLGAGEQTPILLDGVSLNPAIQSTTIRESTSWDKEQQMWVTTTTENPTYDYQNATYTLTAAMYTVQATQGGLDEMFGSSYVSQQAVISYLEALGVGELVDESRDDSVTEKLLYISEGDGALIYTPYAPGGQWFMSHLKMLPGESYQDTMKIENRSDSAYTLYMQVVPMEGQETMLRELLEYISMDVYLDGELLYRGTALGKAYAGSLQNLQDVISLGQYGPGASGTIRVELTLDKDLPMEYADLLTQIDWKFLVEEEVTPPATGDTSALWLYAGLMGVSLAGLLALAVWVFIQERRKPR